MTTHAPVADRLLGPHEPPRIELVRSPTPLHPAPRLSAELGVPVLFKRDDLTGLGLGGNKVRGLEYLIADALRQGCDCLVTGAGPQSNWTLLAALTALRYGIEPHVVCYGNPPPDEGNLRLHRWLGVDVRFTGAADRSTVDDGIAALAAELRATGRRPYVLPRGGATALGSLGYVRATIELAAQLDESGTEPAAVWLPTGSCGTHAGLLAGVAFAAAAFDVIGVTVSRPVAECRTRITTLAAAAAALVHGPEPAEPRVLGGCLGPGYGIPSPEGAAAALLVARAEGVFLDPVFGAKAMAGLVAECAAGRVTGPQVFLVTGGAPTLFTDRKGAS
ncbi:1-aminocyclopropane-1-carboxylate deaminase/D-cysteine desulfhydrase [Amycolatopsis echigonensis]|uniref:D-cysteine desulfhydrase n=1 Tax=Amycolatopsis echigonensis TaxID=2576905 RepID=A0A2N3X107_9PSEU|nr:MULTISPECIES: pyridoxal-phosphate dependent enzyme [Amycolatopsis]MBB2505424.1 pyridoxal-phosphate dependent enzyme [Amycolatopsis echigonensis]PKV99801.1 D-cysteine desulfhydrase [Amycolatopsis niigatensis]